MAGTIAGAIALFLYWQGRTFGSTHVERRAELPGDDAVPDAQLSVTHAATLPVPPGAVWPWIVQVGWGRGGWYTPRWVDLLLFPANGPSAERVLDQYQVLAVGDFVPDGPPETECGFVVTDVEPGHLLVLHSESHLPLSWRRRGLAGVDWSWVFVLKPVNGGQHTRLVFRWRARTWPWWLTVAAHLVVVPSDYVMSRGMFRGLDRRLSGRTAGHS